MPGPSTTPTPATVEISRLPSILLAIGSRPAWRFAAPQLLSPSGSSARKHLLVQEPSPFTLAFLRLAIPVLCSPCLSGQHRALTLLLCQHLRPVQIGLVHLPGNRNRERAAIIYALSCNETWRAFRCVRFGLAVWRLGCGFSRVLKNQGFQSKPQLMRIA